MDLEHLTKKQIILLTLLVSFVTSIATGIVSVSLMQQMPAPVTQTINRVVERTLERVVEKKTDAQGVVTTKEKTVVVKETDLISAAVQAAMPSLVSVYVILPASTPVPESAPETVTGGVPVVDPATQVASPADSQNASQTVAQGGQGGGVGQGNADAPATESKTVKKLVARGVFISDSVIITDASALPKDAKVEVVSLVSGNTLAVESVEMKGGIARLTVAKKSGVGIKRGDVQMLQLGNTLVSLGGEGRVQVATGVVSDVDRNDKKAVTGISLDTVVTSAGAALVNLEGELIALNVKGAWVLQ